MSKRFGSNQALDDVSLSVARARPGAPWAQRGRQDDPHPDPDHAPCSPIRALPGSLAGTYKKEAKGIRSLIGPGRTVHVGRRTTDRAGKSGTRRPSITLIGSTIAARTSGRAGAHEPDRHGGQTGQDLFGRHAAPARPRRQPPDVRPSSCSTSPPRAWTPGRGTICGRSSGNWSTRVRPWF